MVYDQQDIRNGCRPGVAFSVHHSSPGGGQTNAARPCASRSGEFQLAAAGPAPATNRLNLLIGLPLRNPGRFTNLLAQLYDPRSANFHRWLTPDQIAQQFGPDDQDYQAVIAYAKTNGLTVTATHADHTLLRVQGAVADIEKILHVTMRVYQHPWETRTFYAPDVEPSLDLSVPLLHISGLDNFHIPHPGAARGIPSNILADANMGRAQPTVIGEMIFGRSMFRAPR